MSYIGWWKSGRPFVVGAMTIGNPCNWCLAWLSVIEYDLILKHLWNMKNNEKCDRGESIAKYGCYWINHLTNGTQPTRKQIFLYVIAAGDRDYA